MNTQRWLSQKHFMCIEKHKVLNDKWLFNDDTNFHLSNSICFGSQQIEPLSELIRDQARKGTKLYLFMQM